MSLGARRLAAAESRPNRAGAWRAQTGTTYRPSSACSSLRIRVRASERVMLRLYELAESQGALIPARRKRGLRARRLRQRTARLHRALARAAEL